MKRSSIYQWQGFVAEFGLGEGEQVMKTRVMRKRIGRKLINKNRSKEEREEGHHHQQGRWSLMMVQSPSSARCAFLHTITLWWSPTWITRIGGVKGRGAEIYHR
jgi:hypothetical protein